MDARRLIAVQILTFVGALVECFVESVMLV